MDNRFLIIILMMISNYCFADPKACYSNLSQVMNCYVDYQDNAYKYELIEQKVQTNLVVKTYILDSQKWPIGSYEDIPTTTWQHKLKIYIPDQITTNKAMLYIAGGYNTNAKGEKFFSESHELLEFAKISKDNGAVTAVIEEVPNQSLLINGVLKKEDQIMAYAYKKVMQDPYQNAYLSPHLPMVKSVVRAMDAIEEIVKSEQNIEISDFMLVGASKRGWAAWLTALEDKRVSSLVPIVIDLLNVQQNINHICKSYLKGCPQALGDYLKEGVIAEINSDQATQLMQIEDPFSYLKLPTYSKQASIPKYVINAAGDDFYAPDSSKFYFSELQGENYIRYLPKAMHYFAGNAVADHLNNIKSINQAIDNYFFFQINNIKLPAISWNITSDKITIDSSVAPSQIKLWHAHNDYERDFRFLNSYTKYNLAIKWLSTYLDSYLPITLCDNCYYESQIANNCNEIDSCHIEVGLTNSKRGWDANFVELYYNINGKEFIVTTEVGIAPDTYPSHF